MQLLAISLTPIDANDTEALYLSVPLHSRVRELG